MSRPMKDSGIEWIGEIPQEWGVLPIGRAFSENKNKNTQGSITNALQFKYGTIIRKTNFNAEDDEYVADTILNYNIVEPRTIMINCLNLNYDFISLRVGIVEEKGIITSAYLAIKPDETVVYPYYANFLFKSYDNCKAFHNMGIGIRKTLNWKELKTNFVLLPPLAEQKRIADFLDRKSAEIDTVIKKTEESIEEYKKLKQSIITEAVTKGIRPGRKMKPSGIEWIGDIPEEWEVKRTKYVCNSLSKGNGITKEDVLENGEIMCVRYGEIYSKYNNYFVECFSRTNIDRVSSPKYIFKGDILFAATGELVEEIGKNIVYLGDEPCLAGGDIIVASHRQDAKFLNYSLNSICSQGQKSNGKTKLKVIHISASDIGNIFLALPSISEQKEISDFLDRKSTEIDKLIEAKKKIIEELTVYRKSMIYEYVTGKREVI